MAYALALAKKLEGRLYADEGVLHFVLSVDLESSTARVSRDNGTRQVLDVPLSEIMAHVSANTHLSLDNLNSDRTKQRVLKEEGQFFFASREGRQGPFDSEEEATQAMKTFIIGSQRNRVPEERNPAV